MKKGVTNFQIEKISKSTEISESKRKTRKCNDVMIPKLDYRTWIIICCYVVLKCFLNDLVPPYGAAAQHLIRRDDTNNHIIFIHPINDVQHHFNSSVSSDLLTQRPLSGHYHHSESTNTKIFGLDGGSSSDNNHKFNEKTSRINNNHHYDMNLVSYAANLDKINNYYNKASKASASSPSSSSSSLFVHNNNKSRNNQKKVSSLAWWVVASQAQAHNNNNYFYDNDSSSKKIGHEDQQLQRQRHTNRNSPVEHINVSRQSHSNQVNSFLQNTVTGHPGQSVDSAHVTAAKHHHQQSHNNHDSSVETQHEKPLHRLRRSSDTLQPLSSSPETLTKVSTQSPDDDAAANANSSSVDLSTPVKSTVVNNKSIAAKDKSPTDSLDDVLLLDVDDDDVTTVSSTATNLDVGRTGKGLRHVSPQDDERQSQQQKQQHEKNQREQERQREFQHQMEHEHEDDDDVFEEPRALPLRPIIRGPFEEDPSNEVKVVFAEQRAPIKITCEVDMEVLNSQWMKDGQIVHVVDKSSRSADFRFYREPLGSLTITNVMLEDDGIWQCEAENFRGYTENSRPIRLIVLDPPKPPYLLIDSRRLDAGNIFVPVKENSELNIACISEGGNPKPVLTWEVLLSPAVDRHAQKVSTDVLELQEVKRDMDKDPFKITTGAISEARLPAVYRAHHNARILCVMEHPTLKVRQNASILLDVQYTPSFAITRSPGFGYPLREGIEVSLKCDVDSNPPSTPMWQKDDQDPPVPQIGDGFLNFTSIRREHSGWYKCVSRHLNNQYSSIGYFLSVRYDTVDVTSEPVEQEQSMPSSHNPYKTGQMEVELGGSVTLQCPQGSLGCWSHLDPSTSRLRGVGTGIYQPTGQLSLKDVVYTDAGSYKCIGQSVNNRKKLEVLSTVSVSVKDSGTCNCRGTVYICPRCEFNQIVYNGVECRVRPLAGLCHLWCVIWAGAPTVSAKNTTPVAYPGSPLHLSVQFCANPPAFAARWLHGDRVYHPGNQYGVDVLAYGFIDLPTPYCKEARLTYVHMHEKVPRQFFFIVSSPTGVAEVIFNVNFTLKNGKKNNKMPNSIEEDEELTLPEEIHFPIFGSGSESLHLSFTITHFYFNYYQIFLALLTCFYMFRY